jgi:hypothetical protein
MTWQFLDCLWRLALIQMTVFAKSHHCHSFDHPDKIVVLLLVVRRKRVMTGSGGKIELASESLAQKGAFFTENTPAAIPAFLA